VLQDSSNEKLSELSPMIIRYTQDSIHYRFTDNRLLETTFHQLLFDEILVKDIEEPIEVVKDKNGIYWALNGNRRLFLFKILFKYGMVSEVKVKELDPSNPKTKNLLKNRMTNKNEGREIFVRGEPKLEQKLNEIGEEWSKTGDMQFSLIIANASSSPVENIECPFPEYVDLYDPVY